MLFRRRTAKSKTVHRAVRAACEALEKRQLLTALVNGVFTNTNTAFDGRTIFEYRQANGNAAVRISVVGNITAEFIGARYTPGQTQSSLTLSDLIPVTTATSDVFLFSIYITKADMNSAISIAVVPNTNVTPRPMQPFAGNVTIRTSTAGLLNAPDGGVYLGAQSLDTLNAPGNNIPFIWADQSAFGLRPSSAGRLFAGLETGPGVSLGKFFLGGTITGLVDVAGSMETFYAGNVLTGQVRGLAAGLTTPTVDGLGQVTAPANNFHIGGDIRNLISANSLGTLTLDATGTIAYNTGFQLDVAGRVGQIFTDDSFLGQAVVKDDSRVNGPGIAQRELEFRGAIQTGNATYFETTYFGYDISLGAADADPRFNNDTFATAQYLGTAKSTALKERDVIQLKGALRNGGVGGASDNVDYYAVPMLAGQTFEVQLLDDFVGFNVLYRPRLGIFDPDGRLIATDYSNVSSQGRINKAVRITADRPGSYRIAVADVTDTNFNGATDAATEDGGVLPTTRPTLNYELRVRNTGDLALGGLIANGNIATATTNGKGIEVLRGDLGQVRTGAAAANVIFSFSLPWRVAIGNLRAMEAPSMGILNTVYIAESGPDFIVSKGSVGLLRTTLATNMMSLNDNSLIFPVYTDDLSLTSSGLAVGKNIQVVDCAGTLEGTLLANGGIGVIRAAAVGGVTSTGGNGGGSIQSQPVWQVNVDRVGNDGIIDLIDVTGNINMPAISTGPNGNVRYVHVSAASLVFRDLFFGTGTPEETVYAVGQKAFVTDDSGTQVTLTPLPRDPNTTFPLPPTRTSDFIDPPQLTVLTLPIRDKAGGAIVRVTVTPVDDTSDGVVNPGGGGVLIETGANGSSGSAEIGAIALSGTSNPFTFDPFFRIYVPTAVATPPIRPVDVIARGKSAVDIWNIQTTGAVINSIVNSTKGEIVNLGVLGGTVPDVFTMEAETFGLAKSSTGAAVLGRLVAPAENVFPFIQQRTLIRVTDVDSLRSRRGLGNILANNIRAVVANSDGTGISGVFEGINAPLVIRQVGTSQLTGNLVSVNIGEGVLPSGTGDVALAGIYSDGLIDSVVGSGKYVDIRGDIVAAGTTTRVTQPAVDPVTGAPILNADGTQATSSTPTWIIGNIRLKGGSIIDADIMTTPIAQSTETFRTLLLTGVEQPDSLTNPFSDIASIRIEGNGGIIGSFIATFDLGNVAVNGGFGIISSFFSDIGSSVFQSFTTDGYGIRDSAIETAAVRTINVRGNGKSIKTSDYSASVRFSGNGAFDPYSGQQLDLFNDLNKAMGTTNAKPTRSGVTNNGIIMDSQIVGTRDLGRLDAHQIIARNVFVTDPASGVTTRIPYGNAFYPMRVSFANSAGTINVRDKVDGLALTTGKMESFSVANDVFRSTITASGRVKKISAGTLRSSVDIRINGADGTLDSLTTKGNMYAPVRVSQDIVNMSIGANIGSSLIRSGRNFNSLSVNGSILTDAEVDVNKTLNKLFVLQDIKAGATVRAEKINKQTIGGEVIGDIIIA